MNATQIHDHLIRESFIPATISVDSVQRFIRHNDLKSAKDPNLHDHKGFEENAFEKTDRRTPVISHITEIGQASTTSADHDPLQLCRIFLMIRFQSTSCTSCSLQEPPPPSLIRQLLWHTQLYPRQSPSLRQSNDGCPNHWLPVGQEAHLC